MHSTQFPHCCSGHLFPLSSLCATRMSWRRISKVNDVQAVRGVDASMTPVYRPHIVADVQVTSVDVRDFHARNKF